MIDARMLLDSSSLLFLLYSRCSWEQMIETGTRTFCASPSETNVIISFAMAMAAKVIPLSKSNVWELADGEGGEYLVGMLART